MAEKVATKAINKNVNSNKLDIDFRESGVADVQFSSGMVKLKGFYNIHLTWQKCLIAAALGLLLAVATLFFVKNTGIYSGGAVAFFQGISRIVNTVLKVNNVNPTLVAVAYNLLFWGLYLVFNIVLIVFFSYKMNKEFVYLSAIFICVTQVAGIGLGFIPALSDIQIFGSTSTVNTILKDQNVECIIFYPNIFPSVKDTFGPDGQVVSSTFDWTQQLTQTDVAWVKTSVTNENLTKAFSLVIYAFLYSFVYAFCNAAIFILGGSSMGTESVAVYISEKKNKDVGIVLRIIQTLCLVLGVLTGSYVSGIIAGNHAIHSSAITNPSQSASVGTYASWQYIINANLVASFIFVIINSALINSLFPTRKLVRVEIFTKEAKSVLDNLRKHKYPHPTTVINSFGGYSGASNNMIVTVLPIMSLTNYVRSIREVDKVCLIAVTALDDCVGRMGIEKHVNLKAAYDRKRAEMLGTKHTDMQLKNRLDIKDDHVYKKSKGKKKR